MTTQETVTLTRAQVEELRAIIHNADSPLGNRLQDVSARLYFALDGAGWTPAPVAAPASIPQAIDQLVSALAESKGWMRDYARALIEDAIDRRGLDVAAPAPASEAVAANLNGAVASLQAAVIFLDQMREAAKNGEDVTGTGAARDAREWLETAARGLIDALSTPSAPGDSADAPVQQAEHYRAAAESALRALEVYMKLPSDRWPGPPTTAVLRLSAALKTAPTAAPGDAG